MPANGVPAGLPSLPASLQGDRAAPALIAAGTRGVVLWANGPACRLFGTSDLQELGTILFHSGPAARAFATRLGRLESQPRFERLLVPGAWPAIPITASCHLLGESGADRLALLRFGAPVVDLDGAAGPSPEGEAPAARDREGDGRVVRVLWETDRDGVVTHVGRQAVPEPLALAPGDRVSAKLRPIAPALADRIERALQEYGSVGRSRVLWPRGAGAAPLPLEIGCTARPGLGGLRGFLLFQDRPDPAEAAEEAAAGVAPGLDAADAAPPAGQEGSAEDTPAPRPPAEAVPTDGEPADVPRRHPPPPGGNVVHFPGLRLPPPPAEVAADPRPASQPGTSATPVEEEAPRWSESPDGLAAGTDEPESLTADEQDAFAHIARVLGTRPSDPSRPDAETTIDAVATGPSESLRQLLAALPVGVLLDVDGQVSANPALLARLGDGSVEAFLERCGRQDPFTAARLTRVDASPVAAEALTLTLEGRPARLLVAAPSEPPGTDGRLGLPPEILDRLGQGHLRLGPTGTLVGVSPKAAALFEADAHTLLGLPFHALVPDAGAAWRPPSSPRRDHVAALTRTGTRIALTLDLVPAEGGTLCLLSREDAADEAEAARQEAERASARKSEFLAKVSHEIRTPLNAILGFAEVIRDERLGPVGNSRYLEYLRDIHASGTHVMSLVNDLLDLSRIEAGHMDLRLEAVDANAVVQSCVNTLQTQAHRERIIMRLSLAPHLPAALADERSLRQIVLNLLSNAVKFNEPGGQVIVSTAPIGTDAVAIRIRDTGIGMTEDEVATAMEPFRQISTVNRTGSGLGLPVTKALVEANCASMAIKSTRGEGTLVEVVFPVVEAETVSLSAP